MVDQIVGFAVLMAAMSGIAFYLGVRFGRSTVCEGCIAKGMEMGFRAGILEGKGLKIEVERMDK